MSKTKKQTVLSDKLVCRYLKEGKTIHTFTAVEDSAAFMEVLIDSEIDEDFFIYDPDCYVWGDDDRKFDIVLSKSEDRLNIKIDPIFYKDEKKYTYSGYIPFKLMDEFIQALRVNTSTIYNYTSSIKRK